MFALIATTDQRLKRHVMWDHATMASPINEVYTRGGRLKNKMKKYSECLPQLLITSKLKFTVQTYTMQRTTVYAWFFIKVKFIHLRNE